MTDPLAIRAVSLFGPLAVVVALWLARQPSERLGAAALLAGLWNLPALLLIHLLASHFGWWSFAADGGLLLGFPVDLYLGWALLWGPLPVLAFPRLHLALLVGVMASLDLLLMPLGQPVVELGDGWLLGEATGLLLGLLPAQLLARWTAADRHLAGRALLQLACVGALLLGLLPAIVLEQTGGDWSRPLLRPAWLNGTALQLLALPVILGLTALQEFVSSGGGTPFPFDPPRRLVVSGVYAYLANPMQLAGSLLLVGWGLFLESGWLAFAGLVAVAYSVGLAGWDEAGGLARRFGSTWQAYHRAVPRWRPRWHLYWCAAQPARLYVAESCLICAELGRWLRSRRPQALELHPAEYHPTRALRRLTYEAPDGATAEGLAALGRALEHLHVGWACVGWIIRLPLVAPLLQLLGDALDAGPRSIPWTPNGGPPNPPASRPEASFQAGDAD